MAFKSAVLCLKCFPFFSRPTDQSIVNSEISKASDPAKTPILFFLPCFKALANAVHMAEHGTQTPVYLGYCSFNYSVKASTEWQHGPELNRICLLYTYQYESHLFYQKVNDVSSSTKWWGNRNYNIKATDPHRLFGRLCPRHFKYHSSIRQLHC